MPSRTKAAHYRGTYHRTSRALVAAAYTYPDTTCWRCGKTLADIRNTKPHAKWTAGHLVDGQVGGPLAPECSPCNYSAGARLGNDNRGPLAW